MRYVLGFMCVLALGLTGCGETGPECLTDADCDDQNDCTVGRCFEGACSHSFQDVDIGAPCQTDGVAGICLCGHCRVGPFECTNTYPSPFPPCDDGNECTHDACDACTRLCEFSTYLMDCDLCEREGVAGRCLDGVCETEPRCSSDEECDDGVACTVDYCDECRGCLAYDSPLCDDRNVCTYDRCNRDTGQCDNSNKPDGTTCGCARWEPREWPPCWPGDPCMDCVEWRRCKNGWCV
jgi:hypothetical protein